jgi:hypothetical protein
MKLVAVWCQLFHAIHENQMVEVRFTFHLGCD